MSDAKRMSFTLGDGSVVSMDGELTATEKDGVYDVVMQADTVTLPAKMLQETAQRIAELEQELEAEKKRFASVMLRKNTYIAHVERHNELLLKEIEAERNTKKFYELRLKAFNRLWHDEEIPEPLKTWGFNIIANGTPGAASDAGAREGE